ncbi:hypothetical protein ScPMuIL_012592 [Solemya velum]
MTFKLMSLFGESSSKNELDVSKSVPPSDFPPCQDVLSDSAGPFPVTKEVLSWEVIKALNKYVETGGRHRPANCSTPHRVAIIVPYRDREIHLKIFLTNLHIFLQEQNIDYGLFVVELAPEVPFNRALLLNVGYLESSKLYNYNCFIFHDVDLIPEDGRNLYICADEPRHMSVAVDKFHYKLPYPSLFGGVSAMTKEQFETVNGYSNLYFSWGGEDDDMAKRLALQNLNIIRFPPEIARYKMIAHIREDLKPEIMDILKTTKHRYKLDGLNSLRYTVLKLEKRKLYTWILVTVNQTEISEPFIHQKKQFLQIH